MYAKCGSMEDSQIVFNKMPSLDVVTWNALIVGHVDKKARRHWNYLDKCVRKVWDQTLLIF